MTLKQIAITLGLALSLMGCTTQLEEEIGQCEPGVAEISHHATTVTPPAC